MIAQEGVVPETPSKFSSTEKGVFAGRNTEVRSVVSHLARMLSSAIALSVAALCFLSCNTLWQRLEGVDSRIRTALLILVAAGIVVLWISNRLSRDVLGRAVLWICFVMLCYLSAGLLTGSFGGGSILSWFLLAAILPLYVTLLSKACILTTLLRCYVAVACAFAAISLVLWIAGPVLDIIQANCSIVNDWGAVDDRVYWFTSGYFNLLYMPQAEDGTFMLEGLVRNTSIFTEAPMCSFALCAALFIEFFLIPKTRKGLAAVLLAGVVTTFSTTGILLCACALYAKWLLPSTGRPATSPAKALVALVLLVATCVFAAWLLESKMNASSSASTRIDDFVAGFKAWVASPIYGNGLEGIACIQRFMSSWRQYNIGFSNSLMDVLARGGLMLLAVYAACFVGLFIQEGRIKVFAIFYFFLWVFTIVTFVPLSCLVLSFGSARLICGDNVFGEGLRIDSDPISA